MVDFRHSNNPEPFSNYDKLSELHNQEITELKSKISKAREALIKIIANTHKAYIQRVAEEALQDLDKSTKV